MKLSQLCINRPVFTIAMVLVLIFAGVIAFFKLPVRFAPVYNKPAMSVIVSVPNASPEYGEENVAVPLEKSLLATPGIDLVTSISSQNQTTINLDFQEISLAEFVAAQADVLQKINATSLPAAAQQPKVLQGSDNNAVMMLGISSKQIPEYALNNYVNNSLAPLLNQVPGVAGITVFSTKPVLRIALDPKKMATLKISVDEIKKAVSNSNLAIPLGTLLTAKQAIQMNSKLNISTIAGFENLLIAKRGNRLIYLKDIADIAVGVDSLNHAYPYANGNPGIVIEVDQTNQANPIMVGSTIKGALVKIQSYLPAGLNITPVFDMSVPLKSAVNEVYWTIFLAIILVVLVTFAFLGSWRAAFIPIVTIPICLISAFSIMLMLGFTINVMTLLALVLAVGLVVDDAIVVLENTHRYLETGETSLQAARKSIHEISFAVLGITICLVAVYIPVIFLPKGIYSVYFAEFAFSLAGTVLVSGVLALTLAPMMCARLLKPITTSDSAVYKRKLGNHLATLASCYQIMLQWALHRPKLIVAFLLASLLTGMVFLFLLPADLLPPNEINYIAGSLMGPSSAKTSYLDKKIATFRHDLENDSRLENVMMYVNGNGGNIFFMVKVKQDKNTEKVATELNHLIQQMPEFSGNAMVVDANNNVTSSHSGRLYFYITGLAGYREIADVALRMQQALREQPAIASVENNTVFPQQALNFSINYNLANLLVVDIGVINDTLSTLLAGYTFPDTAYHYNGNSYDILLQLAPESLADLNMLQDLYVPNSAQAQIPLSQLVTFSTATALSTRTHINGLRAIEQNITPATGYSSGQAIAAVQQTARTVLPESFQIVWGGAAKNLLKNKMSGNLFIVLALIFVYLVLASLFESFIDPLIILCTVPLCVVSSLMALHLVSGSLNIYTQIAIVTLIGLVTKHGVLITQFANELCRAGEAVKPAIIKAALIRFRPIIMTSLTMILGALPLLFATGTDAVGRFQIGLVMVVGLLFGSFFSLLVVPVAYLLFKQLSQHSLIYNPTEVTSTNHATSHATDIP